MQTTTTEEFIATTSYGAKLVVGLRGNGDGTWVAITGGTILAEYDNHADAVSYATNIIKAFEDSTNSVTRVDHEPPIS